METNTETNTLDDPDAAAGTNVRKKPGPKRRLAPVVRTTLMLEEELVEWGKGQPGGLSDLVRRLLREEKEREVG